MERLVRSLQPVRRTILACVGLAALLLATPSTAHAHGGGFGRFTPPTPGTGGGPGRSLGPVTEAGTGLGGPIVTPGAMSAPTSRRKRPLTQTFDTSWELWWQVNRPALLRRAAIGVEFRPITGGAGPTEANAISESARARSIALLTRLVDPKTDVPPDVRGSACLALAKVGQPSVLVEPLTAWALNEKAPGIVRESAALALGLLRRTEPAQQMRAMRLDMLRATLLQIFDARMDGKKLKISDRTRQFAMFSIALLGDQPFQGATAPGELLSSVLWDRVKFPYTRHGFRESIILAIARQPASGMADGVREGLRAIALGRSTMGMKWQPRTRAYAGATLIALGGAYSIPVLLRHLGDRKLDPAIRIACLIGLDAAQRAPSINAMALQVLARRGFATKQRLLVRGLELVTLGTLLRDAIASGDHQLLSTALRPLEEHAKSDVWTWRGFAAIGLARAFTRLSPEAPEPVKHARDRVASTLRAMLSLDREPAVRGAAAIALGLLDDRDALPRLRKAIADPTLVIAQRVHAAEAVALHAHSGVAERDTILRELTAPDTPAPVRAALARAAARLVGTQALSPLIDALKRSTSDVHTSAIAEALGHLKSPKALAALGLLVSDPSGSEHVRALSVVAIGRILDVELDPSLARFARGFVYPLWSPAMKELLTIL